MTSICLFMLIKADLPILPFLYMSLSMQQIPLNCSQIHTLCACCGNVSVRFEMHIHMCQVNIWLIFCLSFFFQSMYKIIEMVLIAIIKHIACCRFFKIAFMSWQNMALFFMCLLLATACNNRLDIGWLPSQCTPGFGFISYPRCC